MGDHCEALLPPVDDDAWSPGPANPGAGKTRASLLGVVVLGLLLLATQLDIQELRLVLKRQAEDPGPLGATLAMLGLAGWAVLLLPTSPFEVAVGYAFGFPPALCIAWAGSTLGGVLAFCLGRTLFREWTTSLLRSHPLLRALRQVIDQRVVTVVFMVRAAYIPMALKNYGLSVCPGVSLGMFAAVSGLVNLPYSMMWAWWGSQLSTEPALPDHPAISSVRLCAMCAAGVASLSLALLSCHWTARLYAQAELAPLGPPPAAV